MDIKNIIIFIVVFLLIMWLQHNDDLKTGKDRTKLYDKIKIPLVASLLVVLIKDIDYEECFNVFQSVTIIRQPDITTLSEVPNNNVLNDIFIGPPDF
tara:strand:+ start:477 stop:767 length:291 start_codon:yes stop_codon:yes gene_type:complete